MQNNNANFHWPKQNFKFKSTRFHGKLVSSPCWSVLGASDAGVVETLASVPWFVIGIANVAFESIAGWVRDAGFAVRSRRGYRDVPVDEDAQILRFADEEE